MNGLRPRTLLIALLMLPAVALPAIGQDNATTEDNESADNLSNEELDDSVPPPEDDYLDETEMALEDDDLSEDELDDSVPPPDDSYLDDAERESGLDQEPRSGVPGPGAALVAAALGAAAVLVARRR
ncbi:MAG TPA: hypothetical protein VI997_08970 [Candidatus Thermoplasmatota archaeon]|nr:hypothetical protein [Candidatus Thermoplasmatota archaeon]